MIIQSQVLWLFDSLLVRIEVGFLSSPLNFNSHSSHRHFLVILSHQTIPFRMLKGIFQSSLRMIVNYTRHGSFYLESTEIQGCKILGILLYLKNAQHDINNSEEMWQLNFVEKTMFYNDDDHDASDMLILFCLKSYHFLFDTNFVWFCQMATILDFTHNAMSNLLSGHTTKSAIPEKTMADTKIVNILLFCRKFIISILLFWHFILDFTHNAMSNVLDTFNCTWYICFNIMTVVQF